MASRPVYTQHDLFILKRIRRNGRILKEIYKIFLKYLPYNRDVLTGDHSFPANYVHVLLSWPLRTCASIQHSSVIVTSI
jgi:hypothetical protein